MLNYSEEVILNAFQPESQNQNLRTEKSSTDSKNSSQMCLLEQYFEEINISHSSRSLNILGLLEHQKIEHLHRGSKIDVRCVQGALHTGGEQLDTSTSILYEPGKFIWYKCQHAHCVNITIVDFIKPIPKKIIEKFCTISVKSRVEQLAIDFQSWAKSIIRFYRSDWYFWSESHYILKPESWIEAQVIRFIQSTLTLKSGVAGLAKDILSHLKGIGVIPYDESPLWIQDSPHGSERLIPMKSGLFRIDEYIKTPDSCALVIPHTPDYFSLVALNYDHDPKSECPIFISFLDEMIPDKDLQRGIQEFVGSCLLRETNFNLLMLLKGDGANGKSVLLTIIRALLGDENVSAVGLEAFSPNRTFPLAATMGKFANIVAELGEIKRAEEGVLKQYVSGEIITVERKHRDPVLMKPTAKLIIATNNLPYFQDKTNGIYRRIFLVPMDKQVLDRSKQDTRLVDPKFWESSGELRGIFNWALEGLKRLLDRGHFIMPEISEEAKDVYRSELNPASRFLKENMMPGSQSDEILTTDLREAFHTWCIQNGHRAQSEVKFAEEVRRAFPNAIYSENAVTRNRIVGQRKLRARIWTGIKPIERITFFDLLKNDFDRMEEEYE